MIRLAFYVYLFYCLLRIGRSNTIAYRKSDVTQTQSRAVRIILRLRIQVEFG